VAGSHLGQGFIAAMEKAGAPASPSDERNLALPDRCLAVFVDDTGHEALVAGHPVYGLGGCAVLARDLDQVIRTPWREIRRRVTGSPDTPLHANVFARFATPENIATVAEFFRVHPFARFGAIISANTALADDLALVSTIAKVLQARIADIARWTDFDSLAVIFESSQRADRLIEEAFQGFGLEENGAPIPVQCHFMRKEHGEPALEVADFVMHCRASSAAEPQEARRLSAGLLRHFSCGGPEADKLHGGRFGRARTA
jgi:hypothetical protein